uniref:DUF1764-domain-containing protein n=1 Tax=Kalanchoe fedtschenkoi TaxID=63787 RepID=A0A7N1A6E8_KALFE
MGMLAKKSSKGASNEVKGSQVEDLADATPRQSKKRHSDEIDEIFSSKKNNKTQAAEPENDSKGKGVGKKSKAANDGGVPRHTLLKSNKDKTDKETRVKRSNKLPADGDLFGDSSKPRKKASGMKIYTEEELGLNKPDAGGTPLCPFDCDCCF